MKNNNTVLTEQEIKYAVREITHEPEEKLIGRVQEYFEIYPEILEKLTDEKFKQSYISLLYRYNYLHSESMTDIEETEGTGRIILEVLMKENGLNQEEINELLDRNCWRRATQFSVKDSRNFTDYGNYKAKRINWKDKEERSLSVQEVLEVIENRAKEKTEEIQAKKQLTEQLALNQTIEEETIEKFKEKFPQDIESFLLIKKEFENLKKQLKFAELEAKTHYDFIGALQKLNGKVRDELHEEIENNLELLEETKNDLEEQKARVKELEKEKETDAEALQEVSEQFEEQKKISKGLQGQIDLDKKPLPKIPSKFKLFKQKTQAKFKQFQHLAKKAKVQTQEFIARIEVKTK